MTPAEIKALAISLGERQGRRGHGSRIAGARVIASHVHKSPKTIQGWIDGFHHPSRLDLKVLERLESDYIVRP